MARIKIEDLPRDMKISKEEMKNVVGGTYISKGNVIEADKSADTTLTYSSGTLTAPYVPGGTVLSAAMSG